MKLLPALALVPVLTVSASAQAHWPHWRGPLGTGEAPDGNPPLEWSEGENVRWKVEVPGRGKGTPIVWGDHVFVLTAVPVGEPVELDDAGDGGRRRRGVQPNQRQRFVVQARSRADGAVVWEDVANELLPHEGTHGDGSWAAASAVTDGETLLAHFGSRGLYAYGLDGEKRWEVQLGQMETRNSFGEGSSPALYEDTVVVQWDHEGPSFIVALDAATGEERWRRERDEPTSWATPVVCEVDGEPQVITSGTLIRSYDLASGELLWACDAEMTKNAVPTPIHREGIAYVTSGFRGAALVALRLEGARGELEDTDAVLWHFDEDTPYVPSPLLAGRYLCYLKSNNGVLSVQDVETGERVFGPERLQAVANVYASPVAARGRLYLVGRDGEVEVRALDGEFGVLATNRLPDAFDASPAIAERELYLRGESYLWCLAADDEG